MERNLVICIGIIAAGLGYHHYRIRYLSAELEALGTAYLDHVESLYQEIVDEEFNEIVDNYDD